jgi:hypothetical protein
MAVSHRKSDPTATMTSFWREWGLPLLTALALSPLALVAHSYKFVNDDQILYIPFLRRTLDASLYPGDYFFNQPQAGMSLFETVLAWPVRWLGIEWTMLLGYLLAQVLILFCLHLLARRLVPRRAAYLAMVLFILPISIGGTFVRTYDNYFNPRTLTLPLGLLALAWLWERRAWPAAIVVSVHLLLHPLSGLHTWLVAAVLFAWWAWKGQVSLRSLAGPAVILVGALGWVVLKSGGTGALWLDEAWRAVLWQRTPYVFLASWKAEDWISLGLYLLLGILGWRSRLRDPRSTQLSGAILLVVVGLTLAAGAGVDGLRLAPLAQLQLARSWRLVIVLAVIFASDLIVVLYERAGWGGTLAAALLGVALYLDRGDPEWQPVLGLLLVAVSLAWLAEARWGARARKGAEGVLALAGLGLLLPALVTRWPAPAGQAVADLVAERWRLPEDALWPVLLVLGLLLVGKSLRRRPPPQPSPLWGEGGKLLLPFGGRVGEGGGLSRAAWAGLGIGGALAIAALLPMAGEWRQRDWSEYLNDRLQLPVSQAWMSPSFRAWRDVQLWAAANTPSTARFATDPDDKGFRVFSGRSPIVEEKDGAPAMFSRAYALEWQRRMQALALAGVVDVDDEPELTEFSAPGLLALHKLYPFDYVVGQRPQPLPWPEIYRNDVFAVYAWPGE